jgi:CDP-diacylglycerol--serine O-phosphatidyltransferase
MLKLVSIADVISLTNAIFGFLAIFFLLSNLNLTEEIRLRISFSFILLGLLTDGLDGIVARKTRKSDIGDNIESIADLTSLIIAPAIFIYVIYYDLVFSNFYNHILLLIALFLYLIIGVIRLCSFHIMKNKKYFIGLPASVSTIILLVLALFEVNFIFIFLAIVVISITMVTNIHFPKPVFKINAIATILIFLTIILGKTLYGFAPLLLITAVLMYTIGGPIYTKFFVKKI